MEIIEYLKKNGPQTVSQLMEKFGKDDREIILCLLDGGATCIYNRKTYCYEWYVDFSQLDRR